ncbi:hypothetical protein KQX54_017227 [Cotesia glomerata]|uniref:Uncharacterized protein n=1 Tax=Cotesia glomerata TaxID=32391 RepID=A0AAV7HSG3_COTGL|nr:hypothetical protein KQX54_017227 [Cotesia glomerata]
MEETRPRAAAFCSCCGKGPRFALPLVMSAERREQQLVKSLKCSNGDDSLMERVSECRFECQQKLMFSIVQPE